LAIEPEPAQIPNQAHEELAAFTLRVLVGIQNVAVVLKDEV
jgi:hypothetical protein